MNFRIFIPLLAAFSHAHGEPPEASPAMAGENRVQQVINLPGAPVAWMGVDLSKPDATLTSHLPALPIGIGFVVNSLADDGPGEAAGLRETDLLWKLDDQLLVNEGQLSALLRLRLPGDRVVLSVFRGGSQLEIPVRLGQAPPPGPEAAARAAEEVVMLAEQSPIRLVNYADKEARFANAEGRAVVRKQDEGYWLTIHDAEGGVIFDGRFDRCSQKNEGEELPDGWKRRAYVLRRVLDHALEGRMTPQREPRPRVVPPKDESK